MSRYISRTASEDISDKASSFADGVEKGQIIYNDHVPQLDTITEQDEHGHVGLAAYEQSKKMAAITPEQNKRLLRRIDWFLLPLFLATQTLQYLDKTALNYAKVFGMEQEFGLQGQQYALSASIFYIGYLVAQPFWSYLIGRYHAGRILGGSAVIWGITVLIIPFSKNFAGVMSTRFFLGVFEAAVTPGLSLMTGFWYTRQEMPLRQTIWYSAIGWGGMIGALMAAGISNDTPQLKRYQLIFYLLGSITIALGVALYFFLADGPSNAFFLKKEDRPLAVARVADNGVGIKQKNFEWKYGFEALKDLKLWMLTLAMFGSSVPNGVLTNFSGPIIKGLGFSTINAALLDCAGRSFQVISLIIAGWASTRWQNNRLFMMTIGNLICVLGSALMSFLPFNSSTTWPRLIGFWLINCQSIGFTLGLVMISSNIGNYSKRTVTSSFVFFAYCAGNALGPQFAFESEAPQYRSAAYAMLGGYVGKTICHLIPWFYMWKDNKKRDVAYGPADPKIAADLGMQGKSENENPNFRYVL